MNHSQDKAPNTGALDRITQELDAIQHEAWLADLDLRKQAENDPALAAIIADADAQYEATYGESWVNPLADQA